MADQVHPFIKLRRVIRQAGRQFRRNNDTSKSLFFPEGGFIYGYDIGEVEQALDDYECTLPTEFKEEYSTLTLEQKLIQTAHHICATHPNMGIRDFARSVAGWVVLNSDPEKRRNPMKLLMGEYLEPFDEDRLE